MKQNVFTLALQLVADAVCLALIADIVLSLQEPVMFYGLKCFLTGIAVGGYIMYRYKTIRKEKSYA